MELFDIRVGANRVVDDRAKVRLNLQRYAHALQRQHDVGEQDGPIDGQLAHRHQRDFGAQLRRLCQSEDGVRLAQLAVAGEIAAGLAHEPDWCGVDGLAAAGGQEALGARHGVGGGGSGSSGDHQMDSRISAMLPATHEKIGVSRSV